MSQSYAEDQSVEDAFGDRFDDFKKRMSAKKLNIAVVGKVSSGKSSLINALLGCEQRTPKAPVGATSGVTTAVHFHDLSDGVCIVDTPGLGDLVDENSEKTRAFLSDVKVGIFVVTGSADSSQYALYQDLLKRTKRTFVVLNKCDEWDELEDDAQHQVIAQWQSVLKAPRIYPTCTKGYDPKYRKGAPMKLLGIAELRNDIFTFLASDEGADLLLAAVMQDKSIAAVRIIASACAAVGIEAFIPGPGVGTALTTATQAGAIASLYYVYTGRYLSKSSVLGVLPAFAARMIGQTAFLFLKSLLPPTGILDVLGAGVAVTVTLPMLLAVNTTLASGADLENREMLRTAFAKYQRTLPGTLGKPTSAWKTAVFWENLIRKLMYA